VRTARLFSQNLPRLVLAADHDGVLDVMNLPQNCFDFTDGYAVASDFDLKAFAATSTPVS
jgi:hypothetical protein